jgi:hypothetical protein
VGEIDDAVECLEAILLRVHCEAVGCGPSDAADRVCNPACPACSVFKVTSANASAATSPSPVAAFLLV